MTMNAAIILEEANKKNEWSMEEAADYAKMDLVLYLDLLSGNREPNYEESIKLSKAYNIPAAVFSSPEKNNIYFNSGSNYTNHIAYVSTMYSDAGIKELIKEIVAINPNLMWPIK